MAIRDGVAKVAAEYLTAKTQPLRGHPLAHFIRETFPNEITAAVNSDPSEPQLVVQGTKVPGIWPGVPWVAVRDPRLTAGIQSGLYAVYLFAADMKTVFLSLALGVQDTPSRTQAAWMRELPAEFPSPSGFSTGPLPPGSLAPHGIGRRYERANVYFKRYSTAALPAEESLVDDLKSISTLLRQIGASGKFRIAEMAAEPDLIAVSLMGREFRFSSRDVERAFQETREEQWRDRPGIEPYWHVIVGDESKPVKAVFRNMQGVPADFDFTTNSAVSAFEKLGFETADTRPPNAAGDVVLLGTWDTIEKDAQRVQDAISTRGSWASWWSFPLKTEFLASAKSPAYLYLNSGGWHFPYRLVASEWKSQSGNEGIESPWPEVTDSELRGVSRTGPKASQICKTWLKAVALEKVEPPLSRDDFEPALGTLRQAMLNQSAFGYATLKRSPGLGSAAPHDLPAATSTNLILYGPPGTGKTFWLQKKFVEYTDQPTSVDRETWIQELLSNYGWRPVIAAAMSDLRRPVPVPEIRGHPWVQAKAKQRGRSGSSVHATLWSFLQEHTPESVQTVRVAGRRPPFIFSKNDAGWWTLLPDWQAQDDESAELARFLSAGPTGASEPIKRYRVVTFHPSFSYEDFVRGIRPVSTSEDGTTQFRTVDGIFKQICDEARTNPSKRYALFIDEINRANIAKVFGELITLIEADKRAKYDAGGRLIGGLAVQLPGGDGTEKVEAPFGVPTNLDIYGTMNTADRSIALLDVALRRRFEFEEMEPDYALLDFEIGKINLAKLLKRINDRLEYLLDRDHRIGHAYLIKASSLQDLRDAFRVQIIPLLQEYFFDDFSRVGTVLALTSEAPAFIGTEELKHAALFCGRRSEQLPEQRTKFWVTAEGSWTEQSFCGIYESGQDVDQPIVG